MARHTGIPKLGKYRIIVAFAILLLAIVLLSIFLSNQQIISATVTEGSTVVTLLTSLIALWATIPHGKKDKEEIKAISAIVDNNTIWRPLHLPSLSPPAVRPAKRRINFLLLACMLILVIENSVLIFYALHYVAQKAPPLTQTSYPCDFGFPSAAINKLGIGAIPVHEEDSFTTCMGISDGSMSAFDFSEQDRPKGYADFKRKIMTLLAQGNYSSAQEMWNTSPLQAPNDAEMQIYLEDQRIISEHANAISLVIPVAFPSNQGGSRDLLQGAYVLQAESQTNCLVKGCPKLRLLIANAGKNASDAATVSNQIVQAAKAQPTDEPVIGVLGWSLSEYATQAMGILNAARIPMISSAASDDQLSGQSQYFFRIAPRNLAQAHIEALYAHQKHYQRIVVFATQDDSYSTSLATDFSQDSTISASIIDTKYYRLNDLNSIKSAWDTAQKEQPDLIFFAGQASDVSSLLSDLPPCPDATSPSCLKVLGGDALYVLGDYSHAGSINYNRLSFTAFAFPDEWAAAHFPNPPFFGNYARTFDAGETHFNQYGWERPDADVILGYDAVGVVLYAHNLDTQNLLAGLNKITGNQACQGISGNINFQNGDPVDKAIVMLTVSAEGLTRMAPMSDQFYQNQLGYKLPFCQ